MSISFALLYSVGYNAAMNPERHAASPGTRWEYEHNQQTINAYDANSEAYETHTVIDRSEHNGARTWIDYALTTLSKRTELAHLPTLELGSATGRDAAYLESKGIAVQRTDAAMAFVHSLRSKGHGAYRLNALRDNFGGPYRMVFANGVFPHFSDNQARFVIDKAFASLAEDGVLAFSVKTTDAASHWHLGTIEGWDIAIPPVQREIPPKFEDERYYYIRHGLDARALASHNGHGRSTTFIGYNTKRSQWLGIVMCKDGVYDMPHSRTRRSMPDLPDSAYQANK